MGFLYHGSSVANLKKLEPHKSTHGTYVYATPYKELAILFAGKAGGDLTYSLFRMNENEPWQLVERVPNGFETIFSNPASIYTVSDKTFKDINTSFSEVVSEESVEILKEEKLDNVYEQIKGLENEGFVKIYHYPNRPNTIPLDDSDLLSRTFAKLDSNLKHSDFERLLFLHPNLLERVNEKAIELNEDFIPFTKIDLINIFEKFVMLQMIYPDKEFFLKSSFVSISEIYPELIPSISSKLELFDSSKQEKLETLKNILNKDIENISSDLIDALTINFNEDNRTFSEIGKEIIDVYQKIMQTNEKSTESNYHR